MWYFSWILGTGLALSFAVLNAIWYEVVEQHPEKAAAIPAAGAESTRFRQDP
jgi:cyd operon protein YbgT